MIRRDDEVSDVETGLSCVGSAAALFRELSLREGFLFTERSLPVARHRLTSKPGSISVREGEAPAEPAVAARQGPRPPRPTPPPPHQDNTRTPTHAPPPRGRETLPSTPAAA